jgi:hypothetical protein
MKLGVALVGGDEQNFLHGVDLPVRRQFDAAVVTLGARR